MTQAKTTEIVQTQLTRVLSSDQFPSEARHLGARLLDRLRTPVQIVVLGKAGSGKSRLINMLVGHSVYSNLVNLPTCELVYGEIERLLVIRADDTVQEWRAGPDVPLPEDTLMVRLELPIPLLNKFNLTEVSLAGRPANQRSMVTWAFERADVALWCTQSFDAIERALWAPAPDALKDHSFLIITKADQLLMKGVLENQISSVEDVVAQEFHSLYSVATIQAISAQSENGNTDTEVWHASGGHALHEAVLRLVDTGRRADADNALLFLSRYSAVVSQIEQLRPAQTETPKPITPDLEVDTETAATLTGANKNRAVFVEALDFLQDRAERLAKAFRNRGGQDANDILDQCLDTANELNTLLSDFDSSDDALADLQNDVLESADMMLLLQLEQSQDAATDAVTLLLQLKKEVAEKTAG